MTPARRLLRLLAPRWPLATGVLVSMGISAASTALYAWIAGPLLQTLYDTDGARALPPWLPAGEPLTPTHATMVLGALFGGTALVHAAARFGQQTLLARLGHDAIHELRLELYAHLLRLAPASLLGLRRGELGARVAHEVLRVQSLLTIGLAPLVRNGLSAIALGSLALSLDPVLGGVGLLGVPVAAVLVTRLAGRSRQAYRRSWGAETGLAGHATETARLVPLVRAYAAEGHVEQAFRREADRARELGLGAAWTAARVAPLLEIVGAAALLAVLALALWRLETGALAPEDCVSFLAAMILLYRPIQSLGMTAHSLVGGLASLDRVGELLALPPAPEDPPGALELAPFREELHLEDVHFAYGERPVLCGVTATVHPGEAVAIVGPSGAGKTTLLLVLLGLLEPDRGRIRLDGQDLGHATRASIRAQFGWVDQEPLLFVGTVLDNIVLGMDVDRARAERAARAAGAHRFIEGLPSAYDTPLEEGGANLSVGERQRLCIARALYRDAPILVLDEPTAALDGHAEAELSATIESLLASRTVLLASHRESTVRRVDRVLVLSEGRIVEEGTPAALRAGPTAYRGLFPGP